MPAAVWMRRSNDPLCEDHVHDEQENYPSGDEDLCCNGDGDFGWLLGPDDPHHACRDSSHAETEHHPRHEKFVSAP